MCNFAGDVAAFDDDISNSNTGGSISVASGRGFKSGALRLLTPDSGDDGVNGNVALSSGDAMQSYAGEISVKSRIAMSAMPMQLSSTLLERRGH